MGFLNRYPYTDFHELNLDWFLNEFKKYVDDFDGFKIKAENWIHEYVEKYGIPDDLFAKRYSNDGIAGNMYVYIAKNAGDDNNPGTASQPVKTIQKAFEIGSRYHNDIRLYFIEGGVYEWDNLAVTAMTLHVHASVPGVTIHAPRGLSFYNTHVNVDVTPNNKITFTVDDPNNNFIYWDCGQAIIKNCRFECMVLSNFAGIALDGCEVSHTQTARGGAITLKDCKIINPVMNKAFYTGNEGQLWIYNTCTIASTVNWNYPFCNAVDAYIGIQCNIDNPNNITFTKAIRLINGLYLIPQTYHTNLLNAGAVELSTSVLTNVNIDPVVVSMGDLSDVTFDSNSWRELGTYTAPARYTIVRVQFICENASADADVNIKCELDGAKYSSWHIVAGRNNFHEMILINPYAIATNFKVSFQYANGLTIRATATALSKYNSSV